MIANFDAHIKRMHQSVHIISTANEENTSKIEATFTIKSVRQLKVGDIESLTVQSNVETQNDIKIIETDEPMTVESESIVFDEIIEIDSEDDLSVLDEANNNDGELSYDKQISMQITKMMGCVIINGDAQTQMEFLLKNDHVRYLSVVKMNPDGNCVFSALCHQRFRSRANSKKHINETNRLRADVVTHILKPENFPKFQYHLQDRVYEMKSKSEITDMVAECKHYVRDVLSKTGEWGAWK